MIVLQVVGAMTRALEFRRERLEPIGANAIAVRRKFELDNLGAHLTEHSRASRSRDELGEIQNPVAFQHLRLIRHWSALSPSLYTISAGESGNRQSRSNC